jgi:osmotically-inducible protein OsmY
VLYDLVVNLHDMTLETASDAVVYMAQHPAFQPTPASEKTLADLNLAAQVKLALVSDEAAGRVNVDVRADNGLIRLSGSMEGFDNRDIDTVVDLARAVPGVKEVDSDIQLRPVVPYMMP